MPVALQRASTLSLTDLTPNTVSSGRPLKKSTLDLSSVPAWRRRSASMKVIFSGAPAHFNGPAGSVITAWPPLARKASMACQVASAASGLAYTLPRPFCPMAATSMPWIWS